MCPIVYGEINVVGFVFEWIVIQPLNAWGFWKKLRCPIIYDAYNFLVVDVYIKTCQERWF